MFLFVTYCTYKYHTRFIPLVNDRFNIDGLFSLFLVLSVTHCIIALFIVSLNNLLL